MKLGDPHRCLDVRNDDIEQLRPLREDEGRLRVRELEQKQSPGRSSCNLPRNTIHRILFASSTFLHGLRYISTRWVSQVKHRRLFASNRISLGRRMPARPPSAPSGIQSRRESAAENGWGRHQQNIGTHRQRKCAEGRARHRVRGRRRRRPATAVGRIRLRGLHRGVQEFYPAARCTQRDVSNAPAAASVALDGRRGAY
jgi:hypothetical protein